MDSRDSLAPRVAPFISPWTARLFAALAATEGRLLLVSPYIKESVVAAAEGVLAERAERADNQPLAIRVLTRVRLDDLLSGGSDLAALERISGWPAAHAGWVVEARALDNLHAKVWVMDERTALVGSGNATTPGLEGNVEYGVELRDQATIARILADWSAPWEQAERITAADLAALRQALDAARADEALRAAQHALDRRRAELATHSGAPGRIGLRLPIARSGRLPMRTGAPDAFVEAGEIAASGASGVSGVRPGESAGLALDLRLEHLVKALRWVVPGEESVEGFAPRMSLFSALKMTCERVAADPPANSERAAGASQVRLTWADGVRDVEASLAATAIGSEAADAFVRGPWGVTLGADAIQRLVATLFRYERQLLTEPHVALAVRLAIEPPYMRLALAVWRITSAGEGPEAHAEEALVEALLTVDVAPAPWDAGLRATPSPAVTARVAAPELDAALRLLDAQPGAGSRVVELRLNLFLKVMTLRLGGVRGATEQVVPLHDAQGDGVLAFRVERQSLLQMARLWGAAGDGQAWTIRAPQHAEYIEFEPTFSLFAVGFGSRAPWRCRLRAVD